MSVLLALVLVSSTVFAGQSGEPGKISCKIAVIKNMNTSGENVIREKTVEPIFTKVDAEGVETQALIKNTKFKVNLTMSYLKYAPLLLLSVETDGISTASGMKSVTTDVKSNVSTVVECSTSGQ